MRSRTRSRITVLVVLLGLTLSPSVALARENAIQGALAGLKRGAWGFLASLWPKEGCGIDPDGAKEGCIIDPNGQLFPSDDREAQPKAGCNIDPNGRPVCEAGAGMVGSDS